MNCRRSEELWTDHVDGTLPAPLAGELAAHLERCPDCRALLAAFREAVDALQALEVPEPVPGSTERILAATAEELRSRRGRRPPVVDVPTLRVPVAAWLGVAAVLAVALLWRPPELLSSWSSQVERSARQAYSFGVRTYHQTEQWIDDLNVLRMTVGVAFEDRLDRLNEQLRRFSGDDDEPEDATPDQSRGEETGHDRGRLSAEFSPRSFV